MVYPVDDLLLRARLLRRAAQERALPARELLREISSLVTEVEHRLRTTATTTGRPPPPGESG